MTRIMNNLEKYKEDYKRLKEYGNALQYGFIYDYKKHPKFKKFFNELDDETKNKAEQHVFSKCYNAWYNESLRLIKQLLPERYDDFVSFYSAEKKRKDIDITNYTISDALLGLQITRNNRVVIEPADALCGVILEKHFAGVCASHSIKMKKATPGISDYNEKLKDEAVVDNKTYLLIQRLGTIRNLCDHNKKQEPTKDDIEDLINGTDKILHEVL